MHRKAAMEAVSALSRLDEVARLVLYGSVLRGDYSSSSDIDIAVIISDELRGLPLDMEGLPYGLLDKIKASLASVESKYGIPLHAPLYWSSEYEKGIALSGPKRNPGNLLNEVGKVVYKSS